MKRRRVKKEIRNNERWVRKTKKIMRRQLQEFEEEQLKTKLRVIETINEGFKQAEEKKIIDLYGEKTTILGNYAN